MDILIAEQSPTITNGITNYLDALGFDRYRCTSSADEALRHLDQPATNLIIIGWQLSGGTGIDLARTVRAHPEGETLPILMISPHGDRRRVLQALEAGIDAYLLRPFTREDLEAKLEILAPSLVRANASE